MGLVKDVAKYYMIHGYELFHLLKEIVPPSDIGALSKDFP